MNQYDEWVSLLAAELDKIEGVFASLTEDQWRLPTLLEPVDSELPRWTLFELAGHFDISMGLTGYLVADPSDGVPGRDRVSFFINPRSETGPVVYAYAFQMVEGKTPADMPTVLQQRFSDTITQMTTNDPDLVGPGYFALMTLREWVPTRVVEAVVHGIDLTDALGQPCLASGEAISATAQILDELLARRTVGARPSDLADDLAWVRAASGRITHEDPRLPLIG